MSNENNENDVTPEPIRGTPAAPAGRSVHKTPLNRHKAKHASEHHSDFQDRFVKHPSNDGYVSVGATHNSGASADHSKGGGDHAALHSSVHHAGDGDENGDRFEERFVAHTMKDGGTAYVSKGSILSNSDHAPG